MHSRKLVALASLEEAHWFAFAQLQNFATYQIRTADRLETSAPILLCINHRLKYEPEKEIMGLHKVNRVPAGRISRLGYLLADPFHVTSIILPEAPM